MSSMGSAPAVLVVEDDPTIGRNLQDGLRSHGYPTTWCRTGAAALLQARNASPAIVLLDLGLPDIDGVDLARVLRTENREMLLVILTARSEDIDVIAGLDAGADDYLVKPFSVTVLLARLRAHLRRQPPLEGDAQTIQLGALIVDQVGRRCLIDGREIQLRPKEFDLLAALATQPGAAVSREDLMSGVWDANWYGSTKTLDVTMAALRRRLTEETRQHEIPDTTMPTITTLRGHGYRLDSPQ
jgi:DNA-binding response OmpR family regulator